MATRQKFRLMKGGRSEKKSRRKGPPGKAGPPDRRTGRFPAAALAVGILLFVLGAGSIFILTRFRVVHVSVEGNVHYTAEQIEAMVLTDRLSYNSLYLSAKYNNREIKNIPFIETMSVHVDSPDSITIRVYEKSVAGYVEYMGRYMYFDREGIVVESSTTKTSGVPQVTGIHFDHVVLYEPLPVEDSGIFQEILSITQMLSKYEITTDKIYFNEENEVTLYFGQVRARLGQDNLEEKIMRLQQILPSLEGENGVLDMENYSEDRKNVTFQR
ncbi:MAG: cell division protein FtsQ/DivIB [Eubacteriales bacterium]|nr:cell division protein FtsQ/DivIB [Eubacteriales bacterium]